MSPLALGRCKQDVRFHRHDDRSLRRIQRGGVEGARTGLVRASDKQVPAPAGKEIWEGVPGLFSRLVRRANEGGRTTSGRYAVEATAACLRKQDGSIRTPRTGRSNVVIAQDLRRSTVDFYLPQFSEGRIG